MARRIDQDMAAAASDLITGEVDRELRTRYRHLPVMLRTAGLAATYAFIAAKSTGESKLANAYREAARGIRKRLVEQRLLTGDWRALTAKEVLAQLGDMEANDYARASAEVVALTGWLSRLADAMHKPTAAEPASGQDEKPAPSGAPL